MQRCAKKCVDDLGQEHLTGEEKVCLTKCVDKSWIYYDGFFQKQGLMQRQMIEHGKMKEAEAQAEAVVE